MQQLLGCNGSWPLWETGDGWSEQEELQEFLRGKEIRGTPPSQWPASTAARELNDAWTLQARTGIEIEGSTGTVAIGQLYSPDFTHPQPGWPTRRTGPREQWGLLVDIAGLDLPSSGVVPFGGEGHLARYTLLDGVKKLENSMASERFFIYLSTPAVFSRGWLPGWIDDDGKGILPHCNGEQPKAKVRLESAAVGRPIAMGGRAHGSDGSTSSHTKLRMAFTHRRTMYRAVPAGSVYFFSILDGNIRGVQHWIQSLGNQGLSDVDDLGRLGFGLAHVGSW